MNLARPGPRRTVPTPARPFLTTVAVLCVTAVVAILGLLTAGPASAHDVLVSTDPADGATVATAPDAVTLTFAQPALAIGTTLRVTGPGGDVQSGAPRLVDDVVTQRLAPGIPAGSYRIAWRVTSADGHPVSGQLSFTASAANPRAPSSSPSSSPSPTARAVVESTSATPGSGPTTWLWVVLVAVLVAGAGVLWLSRRGAARR